MGPLIVLSVAFLVGWAFFIAGMYALCFIKREWCQAEHWLLRYTCQVISIVKCGDCEKSCTNHALLITRAAMFAFVGAAAFTLAYCVR